MNQTLLAAATSSSRVGSSPTTDAPGAGVCEGWTAALRDPVGPQATAATMNAVVAASARMGIASLSARRRGPRAPFPGDASRIERKPAPLVLGLLLQREGLETWHPRTRLGTLRP